MVSITDITMPIHGIIESVDVDFIASPGGLNIRAVINGFLFVGPQCINGKIITICDNIIFYSGFTNCVNIIVAITEWASTIFALLVFNQSILISPVSKQKKFIFAEVLAFLEVVGSADSQLKICYDCCSKID